MFYTGFTRAAEGFGTSLVCCVASDSMTSIIIIKQAARPQGRKERRCNQAASVNNTAGVKHGGALFDVKFEQDQAVDPELRFGVEQQGRADIEIKHMRVTTRPGHFVDGRLHLV